ncbi:hypothetical protein AAMO2058_001415900 [Amorphochlora amoebiformis]
MGVKMKWQFFRATITLGNKVREKPEIMTVAAALECLMTIEHDYFGKQRPYVDYTRGSRHNSNLKKEYFTTRDGKRRMRRKRGNRQRRNSSRTNNVEENDTRTDGHQANHIIDSDFIRGDWAVFITDNAQGHGAPRTENIIDGKEKYHTTHKGDAKGIRRRIQSDWRDFATVPDRKRRHNH